MLLPLTLSLYALLPCHLVPQDLQGGPPLDRGAIEGAVDGSLRWLRGQQDLKSGSYGSLPETLAALDAFTGSHRAYRMGDGPFVARAVEYVLHYQLEDGSIRAPDATPSAVVAATRATADVLSRLPTQVDAERAAQHFLNELRAESVGQSEPRELPVDRSALLQLAGATLAHRGPDGSWDADGAPVLTSARKISLLNRIAARLGGLSDHAHPETSGSGHGARGKPAGPPPARDHGAMDPEEVQRRAERAFVRGEAFLFGNAVAPGKWGFAGYPDPGITAMVVGGLLSLPMHRDAESQSAIDSALDWLVSLQHEDGSIHAGQLANYVTSASVMALARGAREKDKPVIERAMKFLETLQADEGEGYSASDRFYGGVGYGGDERPDLSNLQMALEALHAGGLEEGSPTYTKALKFLERCQNRSESNDLELVATQGSTIVSGNDGGAGYAPGASKAGFIELPDGRKVARSYGSMTYALLKGYLFAGLPKDDPRVQAAWKWLNKHYTLDVNPGFEASPDPNAPYQGLFYYFTTMSRALDLYGSDTVTDAAGTPHMWRVELASRIASLQRQDGSWRNQASPRWYEGNPVLATAYALLTLGEARKTR